MLRTIKFNSARLDCVEKKMYAGSINGTTLLKKINKNKRGSDILSDIDLYVGHVIFLY